MPNFDAIPPHSPENEAAVLSCILSEPKAAAVAFEMLTPDDFYVESNGEIFWAMKALKGVRIDPCIVRNALEKSGKLQSSCFEAFLDKHEFDSMVFAANVEQYAGAVIRASQARKALAIAYRLHKDAIQNPDAATAQAMTELNALASRGAANNPGGAHTLSHWIQEALDEPTPRLLTGYPELDYATDGGFPTGILVVLAALTSDGKSTTALNIAANMAVRGTGVLFITLEDTGKMVAIKLLSLMSGVDVRTVSSKYWTDPENAQLQIAKSDLADLPFQMSQTSDLEAIKTEVRNAARNGVQFVVVDQISHITISPPKMTKYETVSAVTRELQTLATQTGATILALHQLNRSASESRTGIELHHLRDSGSIEQDARMVLLVKKCERDPLKSSAPAVLTVCVAKHSHGPRGREFKLLAYFAHARVDTFNPEAHK